MSRTDAHNEKRKARFAAAGVTEKDIRFAVPSFMGESESGANCTLCDHEIKNLFELEFCRPGEPPISFQPVGCVCITDWVKAMPASPEREAALARIKEAEKLMAQMKAAKKIENRADSAREKLLSVLTPGDRKEIERYFALPEKLQTGEVKDIAEKVLKFGSFASKNQRGFFWHRLNEVEERARVLAGVVASVNAAPLPPARPAPRPPTPANAVPRPATPAPAPRPAPPAPPALVPECPLCRGETRSRTSARGPFFGCCRFPECRGIVNAFVARPAPGQQPMFPAPPPPTAEALARARQVREAGIASRSQNAMQHARPSFGVPVESAADVARETGQEQEYYGEPDEDALPAPEDAPAPDYTPGDTPF